MPPQASSAPGRTVTQHFDVRATYTDHLFVGGSPLEVTTSTPLDLGVSDAAAVSVEPARGPTLSYSVTASVPDIAPMDLIGRGRYYPSAVERDYLALPFPARPASDDPGAADRWRSQMAAAPRGSEWTSLYDLNQRIVGDEADPYRVALALQQYVRTELRLLAGAAAVRLRVALRRVPLPDAQPGTASTLPEPWPCCCGSTGYRHASRWASRRAERERDGVYVVRRRDAHAWVEAYSPAPGGRSSTRRRGAVCRPQRTSRRTAAAAAASGGAGAGRRSRPARSPRSGARERPGRTGRRRARSSPRRRIAGRG